MTALTDALEWFEAWSHEADSFRPIPVNRWPELKEMAAAARLELKEMAAAARLVADAPEVLYCSNHHQLGNELWCSHGRIWDKDCRMVRRLLVDPGNQQEDE